ncbi:hypothetical protein GGI22_003101 [Coemansia erecta]|nr:hypothetical protein GGI22_003101 [Coemansia erecta]
MTTALKLASPEPESGADEKKCPTTSAQTVENSEPVVVAEEEKKAELLPTASDATEQEVSSPVVEANDFKTEESNATVEDDDVRELDDTSKKIVAEDTEASAIEPAAAVTNDEPHPKAEDTEEKTDVMDLKSAAETTKDKDHGSEAPDATHGVADKPKETAEQTESDTSKPEKDEGQNPEAQDAVNSDCTDSAKGTEPGADGTQETANQTEKATPNAEQHREVTEDEHEESDGDVEDEEEYEVVEKPRVQIYGSTVSGNRTYKKQAKELFIMLEANEIDFEFICIAADEKAKSYMRRKALGKMTLPQIFVDGEFKGFFEDAFKANEIDELYEWLGLDEEPFEY